jgi:hypothetical protein
MKVVVVFLMSILIISCRSDKDNILSDIRKISGIRNYPITPPPDGQKISRDENTQETLALTISDTLLTINLPKMLYILTQDFYTEGIEFANFSIDKPNSIEWLSENNIYALAFLNIMPAGDDVFPIHLIVIRKTIENNYQPDYHNENPINHDYIIDNVLASNAMEGKNYEYHSYIKMDEIKILKFVRNEIKEFLVKSFLYYTIIDGYAINIEIVVDPSYEGNFNEYEKIIFNQN